MEESVFFTNSLGLRLSGILSRPVQTHKLPLVIMCHGFGSDKNNDLNQLLVQQLDQLSIASLRFDFMGHNDSEGDIAHVTVSQGVDDLRSTVQSLERYAWIDHSAVGLFGHSYGGDVVLRYAADYNQAKVIALLAPVSDYSRVKERKFGAQGIREWKTRGYAPEDANGSIVPLSYEFYEDAKSHNTYELAQRINVDCLILHGGEDDVVPLKQSQALAEALGPRSQLHIINKAGHGFAGPGQMESVISETTRFFQVHLPSRE
jgi:pimeloyl-ACP methyl ester carboxylesterase